MSGLFFEPMTIFYLNFELNRLATKFNKHNKNALFLKEGFGTHAGNNYQCQYNIFVNIGPSRVTTLF